VTVDATGRPVFSDPSYHLIFRVEASGSITVLAGNNVQGLANAPGYGLGQSGGGYSGDGGPATTAALNRPEGVAYDAAGNLYIADLFNHRIRMVNTQGIITTFAGTGQQGFSGDGGPAALASFNFPTDVAVDASGNVYVNDSKNYVIRKITPQGTISTVAGTGVPAVSAAISTSALATPLADIEGMVVDAQGNLYLADFTYSRVLKISSAAAISTVTGNGLVTLSHPGGLAFDPTGNLLISDTNNFVVRKLALTTGVFTTVAGTAGQAGFAGDGGLASNANLNNPFGLAVTQAGAIYIADRDNFRIRTVNSTGTISTAAGNGALISSQNGIPADLATLLDPFGVSFDYTGSMLIADTDNNIIRRMTGGTVATIAGTGAEEEGLDGPATKAGLYGPFSVNADTSNNYYVADADASPGTVRKIASGSISTLPVAGLNIPTQAIPDSSGNLWIADFNNNRILRDANGSIAQLPILSPGGIALDGAGNLYVTETNAGQVARVNLSTFAITTIAAGGTPTGITVDSAGSVYFSDASTATVKKVTSNGTISTVAGNGHSGFSGDGGPATSASLGEPWGLALDSSGALYIADVLNNRIRKVLLTSSPSFTVDQSLLSFSAPSGGKITSPASLNLNSSLPGLLFSVTTDQPWLTATPASGAMPSQVQVTADPTGLTSSATGHVTITALGASPAAITVAVNFTITGEAALSLASDTSVLSYAFVSGASAVTSQVSIRNLGSGSLGYSVASAVASGAGWLSVSPASGSATPNAPGVATVTITPGQLAAGTYTGTLTITGPAGTNPVTIPVSASVVAPATKLQITQAGITFRAIQGGGKPLSRSFACVNVGSGSMDWTAAVTSPTPWLTISPSSGTVATPFTDAAQVTVSVNPAGLAAGTYYGLISVNAAGNSTQTVTVALNVLAPSSGGSAADVYPAGLVFTSPAQGQNPSSQSFSIANLGSQPLTYTSSRLAASGQPWFVQVPATGVISPGQFATVVVQPDFSNLQSGSAYQGSIALQFSDGSHATVNLSAAVIAGSLSAAALGEQDRPAASGCTPKTITTIQLLNSQPLAVTLGQGVALEVNLLDNCGPVTGANRAAASVGFSNKDAQVNLSPSPTQAGLWTGSWTPTQPSSGPISLSIIADEANVSVNQLFPFPTASIVPPAVAASTPPIVSPAAVLNGASFASGMPVSPGGLITIFGSDLADATAQQAPPLPTSLGNTQILLGGRALPLLYVSTGQVNAQVPPDLQVNTQNQILVQRNSVPSVASQISVSAASPAIFTQNSSGTGQGAITNAITGAVANASNPVTPGVDYVSIYCTGLGVTNPAIAAGQPAPSSPPFAPTVNTATVTIGGLPAQVLYAGLAPTYAGLYQVNAAVPAGLSPGNQPVVVSIAGQSSPPGVTIAVK
jgi:uncharacterized protein (TIGR03437 family)